MKAEVEQAADRSAKVMGWKQWSVLCCALSALAAAGIVSWNVLLDPYGVFETDLGLGEAVTLDERFRKVEHVLKNPDLADSFMIGSSVMGLFPAASMPKDGGSNWYNLAFQGGGQAEALRALKALEAAGVKVKQVALGIDLVNFREVAPGREMWKREHPAATGQSWARWWLNFAFASSGLDGFKRVEASWKSPDVVYEIERGGEYRLASYDAERIANPDRFIKDHHKTGRRHERVDLVLVDSRFEELRELIEWLKAHKVKVRAWINPMYQDALDGCTEESLDSARRRIMAVTGKIPDLTVKTALTRDGLNFYDDKHFSPQLAERVIQEGYVKGGDLW